MWIQEIMISYIFDTIGHLFCTKIGTICFISKDGVIFYMLPISSQNYFKAMHNQK